MRSNLLYLLVWLIVAILALAGCLIQPQSQQPLPTSAPSTTLFSDVADESGIHFSHIGNAPVMPLGGGVAWGDSDNDGWLDLYVTNQGGANALYRNQGDGTFLDRAADAGVTAPGTVGGGAQFVDYDNDGWQDIYLVNQGANLLFHNRKDRTFEDVTAMAGVGDAGFGQSAAWGDYDNDGWLDLYVVNHIDRQFRSADRLYHNRGDGTFEDVSDLLSEHFRSGAGFVASFLDYDSDSDLDLYVVNDKTFGEHRENVLWQNEGMGKDGRWRFRNVSTRSHTNVAVNGMGLAVGDFDNNSTQDFAVTNIGPNVLLANNGFGEFANISQIAGIRRARLPEDREPLTWCALSLDYDNDGWLDLFLCGSPLDKGKGLPSVLYHNAHDGTFEDATDQSGVVGEYWTRAGAYADYDQDGTVDFAVSNYNQPAALYHNNGHNTGHNTGHINHWLTVRLRGVQSNRDGIGAKVRVTANGQTQFRQIQSGGSLGAGNDLAAYFGLGEATVVERLEIEWSSGIFQILSHVASDQMLTITETAATDLQQDLRLESLNLPAGSDIACGQITSPTVTVRNLGSEPIAAATLLWRVTTADGQAVVNEHLAVSDLQPMALQSIRLPGWQPQAGVHYTVEAVGELADDEFLANNHLQSSVSASNFSDIAFAAGIDEEEPGSGVTTGDFNGDGWADLYLVNSGRPNRLYLNQGDGTFEDATERAGVGYPSLSSSAITADFDGDGALDIYLLNINENNVYYHNRGDGSFEDRTIPANLSNRGTSRVALSGDFDGDSDLDIYLVNDGQANVLFLNQGNGTFQPAAREAGVADRGGGRGAVAGDFDSDGALDIYLVKDREPNVLFLNQGNGTFTEALPAAGVADTNRSWNVVSADFDSDGDLDLYVANLAQANTLYLNRGDGSFEDGSAASGLGSDLNASTSAMAADFNGDTTLDLLVGNTGEQPNLLYLNDGKGHFRLATEGSGLKIASNSVALATADFNKDGILDLYVVNANLPDQLFLNSSPQNEGCWR